MSPTPTIHFRRSALMMLLAALFLVTAPHVPRLPPMLILFGLAVGGWWGVQVSRHGHPPLLNTPLRLLLIATIYLIVLFRYGYLMGRDAGVAILLGLMFLKLMEFRERRDPILAAILGYFLAITNFLYDQTPVMALYLLFVTLLLTAALTALSRPGGAPEMRIAAPGPPPRETLRIASRLTLQALPVALVLFVLFPRVPGPLWALPDDAVGRSAFTGVGNSMEPGSITQLTQSYRVAFRVRFHGDPPPRQQLYWRGPVLWHFDGRVWNLPTLPLPATPISARGFSDPITMTITMEPNRERRLFVLGFPVDRPPWTRLQPDLQLLSTKAMHTLIRYEISAVTRFRLSENGLGPRTRAMALQLPRDGNPQARQLAKRWRRDLLEPEQIVETALRHFRSNDFSYTLRPPAMLQDDIDLFLFTHRRGFCEHYAGAFTFLMRAAGVPARVVIGYQGGDLNPYNRNVTIRQSDAHAWVEVHLPHRGWVRIDPTGAIAPNRINRGFMGNVQQTAGVSPLLQLRADSPLLRQIRNTWDALDARWNDWVIDYDHLRQ
ncbi:MAG: DUF3488 domain-containing transglutaminase family protein, partial [Magnetococcales bacterium]|nr:DUF3488 domain-containing transglutaminase family protein [Magnetococcales bacterium]